MSVLRWEELDVDPLQAKSYRAEVPGGWIYDVAGPTTNGLVFVPFPRELAESAEASVPTVTAAKAPPPSPSPAPAPAPPAPSGSGQPLPAPLLAELAAWAQSEAASDDDGSQDLATLPPQPMPPPANEPVPAFNRSIVETLLLDAAQRTNVLDPVRTTTTQTAVLERIGFVGRGKVNIYLAQLDEDKPRRGLNDPYRVLVGTLSEHDPNQARYVLDFVLRQGRKLPSILCVEHVPARAEDSASITYHYRLMPPQ